MFHGYLSHERDLIGLAPMLPEEFTLVSVRAPHALGPGFTWFPLLHEPDYSIERVTAAVDDVVSWLDTVKGAHTSVTLLGFSMGMAVATSVLRRRPADIEAVVGLSGFAIPTPSDYFRDDEVAAASVPLFWGRGDADQIITEDKIEFTNEWANANTRLVKMMYANMAHSINPTEMGHVCEFLRQSVLAEAPAR
ncbi:phospholipase/carboxylesterase [Zhihengliuella salsuginis]|uniref:Phospholipase/carboxylesterase n=2 Tax=Zhihengliuella salsuginis TaxID=578222 RepID=A0ABQ3GHY0_9MICC|nr:phospholipase/carboxylesterase [Zhihengliuella salsuginis]